MSTGLQVKLFGCVTVLRDSRPLPPLSSKALELLCYLLLHRSRAHTREVLSGLLWPDAPESHAKKYLRQTLWQLQTNLANGASPDEPAVLDVHDGRVRLNPDGGCWTDVEVVERAHRRCGDLPIGALSDLDVVALEHAAPVGLGRRPPEPAGRVGDRRGVAPGEHGELRPQRKVEEVGGGAPGL